MIYFLSRVIYRNNERLGFVVPEDMVDPKVEFFHLMFDRSGDTEIHGVKISIDQVKWILESQHKECEVVQVDFKEVEKLLTNCRFSKMVDEFLKNNIDKTYPYNEQLRILQCSTTSKDRISYDKFCSTLITVCDSLKLNLGLKQ